MLGVRERLGSELFARVAGPDGVKHAERIHLRPGPRWFEADSPIARVHGDAAMFIGGLRALLLQTLHPAAMRGVAEHSDFRHDAWGRLARTSRFIAVTTFGTADDAEQSVAAVRRIHEHIDPHLLGWVHVAEIDSFLRAHTVYGREPLTGADRDTYVAQTAAVARRLGVVDPPTTEAELAAALASYRPELRGTPEARATVGYLLLRPPLPMLARAPYGVIAAAAVGLMPRWTRLPLRLPYLPVSERTVVRALGGVATGTIRWAMTPREQLRERAHRS
jgi:uncharacterized protein (DUF2236 family)